MDLLRELIFGGLRGGRNVRHFHEVTGSVTLSADSATITIPQPMERAKALLIYTDKDAVLAAATRTIYEARGALEFQAGRPEEMYSVIIVFNKNGALSAAAAVVEQTEEGYISVPTSMTWKAGLEYQYRVWYWD